MIKILLIDNSLDTTGASLALIKLAEEIRGEDIEFVFVFPKDSNCIKQAMDVGFKTYGLPMKEISKRISGTLFYFPVLLINTIRVRKIIKEEKIDLIHVNDIYNMIGLCVKAITKIKVITHIRRMPESFPTRIYKSWSWLHTRFADRIIAVSKANKHGLPPNNKTEVIYDSLPQTQCHNKYTIKNELQCSVNILYLANYTVGKGHQHALEVMRLAINEFPDWRFQLNFYGGDFGMLKNNSYKDGLISMAKDMNLDKYVSFNTKCTDVEKEMKAHDVVWNFSDSESFSRVTLEALFYGVPVIATDVGGTGEMMIDGKSGILVKAKEPSEMYAGFKKLIKDDHLRVSFSKTGYEFVRAHFDVANTSMKMKKVYFDVLGHDSNKR